MSQNSKKTYTEAEVKALLSGSTARPDRTLSEWDRGVQEFDRAITDKFGNQVMDDITKVYQYALSLGMKSGKYKLAAGAFGDIFKVRAYALAPADSIKEARLIVTPTPTGNKIEVADAPAKVKRTKVESTSQDAVLAAIAQLTASIPEMVNKAVDSKLADLTAPM